MGRRESRYISVPNIRHVVLPTLVRGAVLNPERVGDIYCKILQEIFQQAIWPGHIHVHIGQIVPQRNTLIPLGELDILNIPGSVPRVANARGGNSSLQTPQQKPEFKTSAGVADDSLKLTPTSLRSEPMNESVWLQLFTSVMLWAFKNPCQVRLSVTYPAELRYFQSSIDGTKWLSLVITLDAVKPRAPYRWLDLVRRLLDILIATALEGQWRTMYWLPLRCDGVAIAWVSIGDKIPPTTTGLRSKRADNRRRG